MAKRVFTDESLEQLVSEIKSSATTSLDSAKSYTDTAVKDLASTSVVDNKISNHNTATAAHSDIRALIAELSTKLNQFLDVDDTTTDQLSEVLTLIENNNGTLESITTTKVNVSDIVDDLATSVETKVLSAKQGVAIKALIDALDTELTEHGHEIADVSGLQDALDGKAASTHGTHVTYSETAPVMDGTASVGSAATVARSDHKHPTDTSRASQSDLDALTTEVGKKALATDLSGHTTNTSNPHSVTKAQVGLGNVNNTSDADKPVSTAQAAEIAKVQTKADEAYALAGTKADAGHIHAAEAVTYDNTTSGLTATNVKDAIDEVQNTSVKSWKDLADRPVADDETDTLTWDGIEKYPEYTTGRWYYISDAIPTAEDLSKGITVSYSEDGTENTCDNLEFFEQDGYIYLIDTSSGIDFVRIVDQTGDYNGNYFSNIGIYFYKYDNYFITKSLTIEGYTGFPFVERIDEQYIPNSIQRKITGEEGQIVVIGSDGNAVAQDITSDSITYDNTTSGLTATNVQDAIDEIEDEFLPKSGGTMTGSLIVSDAELKIQYTSDSISDFDGNSFMRHVTLKSTESTNTDYTEQEDGTLSPYVEFGTHSVLDIDEGLSVSGDSLFMNNNRIRGLANPEHESDAVNRRYIDKNIQPKITGTAGDFVVIGSDGNVTTKTIEYAEEVDF